MVQWKGSINNAGSKAENLDDLEKLSVPNFFVMASDEVASLFENAGSADMIREAKISREARQNVEEAYRKIGMSSEVRNSSGKARSLVGGQRDNQRVSVRVSNSGEYNYRLNVGSSDLIEALKDVTASYYELKSSFPDVLVQKMVEPEHSGSVVIKGDTDYVEVVDGLGTSLEEGSNRPYIYVSHEELEASVPEQHFKVSRNPMNGERRRKRTEPELPFEKQEVKEFMDKIRMEGVNIKFVYKRGDFHVVDAWKEDPVYEILKDENIQGVKVSPGELNGEVGKEITYSGETLPPSEYGNAIVSSSGGYTSRDAERAREEGKPAVFSFRHRLEEGQKINMDREEDEEELRESGTAGGKGTGEVTAAEVLPLNPRMGRGVSLEPPHGPGYIVTREAKISDEPVEGYVDSHSKAFAFDGDYLILDARKLEHLKEVIDYLEAGTKIIIFQKPEIEVVQKAVEAGFDVYSAPESRLDQLEKKVLKAEKRFMMEKLRNLD